MATRILQQVHSAILHLDPGEVRQQAERLLRVRLLSSTSAGYAAMEDFLAPAGVSRKKRGEIVGMLFRDGDAGGPEHYDLEIRSEDLGRREGAFAFSPDDPGRMVAEVIGARDELGLPLARAFPPFQQPVSRRIILAVSRENALFALATALPNLAPGLVALPWALGEAASDTAVLTANQIGMVFLLGAACDRPVGYREQKKEIASLIAGAFGWRALARELAGKIPLGAGVIPKAAIAFAGTWVAGVSLERLYRIGYGLTRQERRLAYGEAVAMGRQVASTLWNGLNRRGGG